MRKSITSSASLHRFLLQILLLCFLQVLCFAEKKSYIVYLGSHSHDPDLSSADFDVRNSHYEFLGTFLGSSDAAKESIFYSYTRHINGFAATLEQDVAEEIARHPQVLSMFLNRGRKLHTTRSWDFLGLEHHGVIPSTSLWNKARFGEDVIIANLDTGVWPESKSFSDEGYGPIPSKWRGICQSQSDPTFHCNRKLIGARYFNQGYAAAAGKLNASFDTPRDKEGHGSHTLSTAAGNFVANVSVCGQGFGSAKGGSPRARVAAYKVCWPPVNGSECFDADILGGFESAIEDGVDVISVSLGGAASELFNDSVAIGSFHAAKRGISVVCSAGNSGPDDATVENLAPWFLTVAASTMDRQFPAFVTLGNNLLTFKGQSLSATRLAPNFYPMITGLHARKPTANAEDARLCQNGTLDPMKVKGKILVCLRGENARVDKGEQALLAGAVGMVLANDKINGNEILADPHVLPASHVNYTSGISIFTYLNSTKSPVGYITHPTTKLHTKPAPFMAAFSSKGPNPVIPEILKPDITAPGVSVIAAYTEAEGPTNQPFDTRRIPYNSISGTSMSCPHVSGIVGLLRTLHPSWSPAAIKSAIMTTASTYDNEVEPMLNASNGQASPFSYGAGHIDPNRAMDPGLVYDATIKDYLNFLCALGYNASQLLTFTEGHHYKCHKKSSSTLNLNLPSITVPNLKGSVTISRTLKNVGSPATYVAHIQNPPGISISVKPSVLKFKRVGEEKSFKVIMKVQEPLAAKHSYVFGKLVWSDGKHLVKSPIVAKAI